MKDGDDISTLIVKLDLLPPWLRLSLLAHKEGLRLIVSYVASWSVQVSQFQVRINIVFFLSNFVLLCFLFIGSPESSVVPAESLG